MSYYIIWGIWGIWTAIIAIACLILGTAAGYWLHRAHARKQRKPTTRPLVAVPMPQEEKPRWERELDETGERAWKNTW